MFTTNELTNITGTLATCGGAITCEGSKDCYRFHN
jgi:hypothetical protein